MPTCLYLKDEGTMQDGVHSDGMKVGSRAHGLISSGDWCDS